MPAPLKARYFDGRSARALPCTLQWDTGTLVLSLDDGSGPPQRHAAARVVWPERTRHGQRQLLLEDGGVVSLDDAATWDRWAAEAGVAQPLAARWALHWRGVLLALLLLAGGVGAAWRWGIPWGAAQVVQWVPQSTQERIGQQVRADLQQRGWLLPSELSAAARQRIEDEVAGMVARAFGHSGQPAAPAYRLHIHQGPKWLGPNAFALPGGDIVITDALVKLLQSEGERVHPALLGVVAHELGHVRQRHGLRLLIEAGAVGAVLSWWIGDYSALLAGAPTLAVQAAYSRRHEFDADTDALRVMRAAGLDPREMHFFFLALKQALPERDGDDPFFGLATHPTDSERMRRFE